MLPETVIRRVTLSRYLFRMAADNARANRSVALSASINLLQDGIEIFMLAAAGYLNAQITVRTDFVQYIDKINERLSPKELPYRQRLLEINRVRVGSKHHGISPNPTELTGYLSDARHFLEQACNAIFRQDFWTISLLQLLENGETKELLTQAETDYQAGDFVSCLYSCRKAFFLEFERRYDIKKFEDGVSPFFGLALCDAPYFAQSQEYIKRNVYNPFDYIVLDHSALNSELVREGIDNISFWNVWRLTPQVYRHQKEDPWALRHDPHKLEEEGIADRAAYVLETTIDIILQRTLRRRSTKWVSSNFRYVVKMKRDGAPVYEKADSGSAVVGSIPAGVTDVVAEFATPALRGEGLFWKVYCEVEGHGFLSGYIHQHDVQL